jgi:hypothetical protein
MDPIQVILSEIIRYKGLSVSQCMRRLTTPDGTGGPSACVFPTQQSSTRVMTLGGGGFGARAAAPIPNSNPS